MMDSIRSSLCNFEGDYSDNDVPSPWWQRTRTECSDYVRLKTFLDLQKLEEMPSKKRPLPKLITTQKKLQQVFTTLPQQRQHFPLRINPKPQTSFNKQHYVNVQSRYLMPSRTKINTTHENIPPLLKLSVMMSSQHQARSQEPSPQKVKQRLVFDPYQLKPVRRMKPPNLHKYYDTTNEFTDDQIQYC